MSSKYNITTFFKDLGQGVQDVVSDLMSFISPSAVDKLNKTLAADPRKLEDRADEIVQTIATMRGNRTGQLNYLLSILNSINGVPVTSVNVKNAIAKTRKKVNNKYEELTRMDNILTESENRDIDKALKAGMATRDQLQASKDLSKLAEKYVGKEQ